MDGVARWQRGAFCIAVVALALVAGPAAAAAAPAPTPAGPPSVAGLPVTEATDALAEWNGSVLFVYLPSAELTVDVADVVVARVSWSANRQVITAAAARPVATLTLGRRVPDLAGLTRDRATTELQRLEFVLAADPSSAPATWVVRSQQPLAGTIVEFTPANTVTVTLADPTVVEPRDPRWLGLPRPAAIAVGGTFAALLVVLVVLGSLLMRRAVRRRAAGPERGEDSDVAVEQIDVRLYAGQVVGPELSPRGRS